MIDYTKIISQSDLAKQWKVSRAYISQLVTTGRLNSIIIAGRKFVITDQKLENFKK